MALIPRSPGQQRYGPSGTRDFFYDADKKNFKFNQGVSEEEFGALAGSEDAPQFVRDYNEATASDRTAQRPTIQPTISESIAPSSTGGGLIGDSLDNIRNIASGDFTPTSQQTVEGRLTGLLADESPLIELEERKAVNLAGERGLQNTLLAATAGRKAAIEAALPIAQQDAGFLQSRSLLGAEGLVQSSLSNQDFRELQNITQLQGDISQDIQAQQDSAALVRTLEQTGSAEQIALAANLSREGVSAAEIESRLELGREEITSIETRATAELEARKAISDAGIAAQVADTEARLAGDAKNNFNSSLSNLHNEYVAQNTAIARDPNLTPEARVQAQADLQSLYETGAASLASIWSDDEVVWSPVVPEEEPPPEPGDTGTPETTGTPAFNQENYSEWFQANKNSEWFKNLQSQGALLPVNFYNWSQENVNEDWFKEMSNQQRVVFFDTNVRPNLPATGLNI